MCCAPSIQSTNYYEGRIADLVAAITIHQLYAERARGEVRLLRDMTCASAVARQSVEPKEAEVENVKFEALNMNPVTNSLIVANLPDRDIEKQHGFSEEDRIFASFPPSLWARAP